MKKTIGAGVVSVIGLLAFADPIVSYEDDGRTLVVTVARGGNETLSSDLVKILNENTVTNFCKRGEGTLTIANDTTGYTGHFRIENGILRSRPLSNQNETLGKKGLEGDGCGSVHVEPGATLAMYTRDYADLTTTKTVYFGGSGYQGMGALTVLANEIGGSRITAMFGTEMIMTSDALVYNDNSSFYVGFLGGGTLDMNSHTLTFGGTGGGCVITCGNNGDTGLANRIGDIVVSAPYLNISQYFQWFCSDANYADHTFTVAENAQVRFNNYTYGPKGHLVMRQGSSIQLNNCDRASNNPKDKNNFTSRHLWDGDVNLDTSDRISIVAAGDNPYYMQFGGPIRGGGFNVGKNVRLFLRREQTTGVLANTFTNGIVVADGGELAINWQTMIPKDGGDVVLTNAAFSVWNGRTYDLPPFRCHGDCLFYCKMGNPNDPGTKDHRAYFPTLQFFSNSSGAFSTNVVVSALIGLPRILPYPATTSPATVRPDTVSTGPEQFLIDKTWDIDVADVVAGDKFLFDGELAFSSGVTINVRGTTPARGPVKRFKIADTGRITFKGAKTVNVESERWSLEEGEDGRSLYLTYDPPGFTLLLR